MGWRLLIGAAIFGLATLGVATLAALEGWLTYGRGFGRVALHGRWSSRRARSSRSPSSCAGAGMPGGRASRSACSRR